MTCRFASFDGGISLDGQNMWVFLGEVRVYHLFLQLLFLVLNYLAHLLCCNGCQYVANNFG
jgi:hypothetical protein